MKKMAKWKLVAAVAASSTMLSTVPVIADEAPAKDNKEATAEANDKEQGAETEEKGKHVVEDPGAGDTTADGKTNEDIKDDYDYALGRGEYQENAKDSSQFLKKPSLDVPFKPEGQAPVTVNLTVNGEGRSNLPVQLLDSGVVAGEGFTDGRGRVTISTPPKDMGSFDMSLQFPKGLKFSNARCTTSGGYDEAKSREATELAQKAAAKYNDENEVEVENAVKKAKDVLKQAELEKKQYIEASKEMYGPTATDMLSYKVGVTIPLAERYDRIKKNEAFPSALLRAKVGRGEDAEKEKEEGKTTEAAPTTTKQLGEESHEDTSNPDAKEGEDDGKNPEEATPTTENKKEENKEEEEPVKPDHYTKEQLDDYTIDLQVFNKFMADHEDITGKAIAKFNETYLVRSKSNITSEAGPAPKNISEIVNSLNKAINNDEYFNSLKKSVGGLKPGEKEGAFPDWFIAGKDKSKNVEFLVYDTANKIRGVRKKNPKLHGIDLLEKEFSALHRSTNEKILYLVSWFDVGGATLKTTVPEALETFAIGSFMSNVEPFTPTVSPEVLGAVIQRKPASITIPVLPPTSQNGNETKWSKGYGEFDAPSAAEITKWAKTRRREQIPNNIYTKYGSWSKKFLNMYGAASSSDGQSGIPWKIMTANFWIQEKGTRQDQYDWLMYLKAVEYPQLEDKFNDITKNSLNEIADAIGALGEAGGKGLSMAGGPMGAIGGKALGVLTGVVTGPVKNIGKAIAENEGAIALRALNSMDKMIKFYEKQLGIGTYGEKNEAENALKEAIKEYNAALEKHGYKPIPAFVLEKHGPARAEAGADRNLVSFSTQTGATVDCSVDLNADEEEEDKIIGRDNRSQGGGVGNITMPTPVVNVEGGGKSGGMDEKTLASILDANNRQLSQALKDSKSSNSSNNSNNQSAPAPQQAKQNSASNAKKNDREIIAGAGGPGAGAPAGVQAVGGASGAQGQAKNMSYGPKFGPSVETGGAVAKRGFFERIVDGIKSIF